MKEYRKHDIFDSRQGEQTIPHVRRLSIESKARRNAHMVPGMQAVIRTNRCGNSDHVELRTAQLVITFNHLANANGVKQTLPRLAKYRQNLSKYNPLIPDLFPDYRNESEKGPIHAVLIHEGRFIPEMIALGVLDPSGKDWIDQLPISLSEFVYESDVNETLPIDAELREIKKEGTTDK